MDLDKLLLIRKACRRLGIKLHFLLMAGLPLETKKSLYNTFKLICDLKPETIGVCIVTPYPGTPLYKEAKAKGWIETEDWAKFGGHFPVMHTDNLSSRDLLKARQMINRGFSLLRPASLMGWIKLKLLDYKFKRWALQ
jgi:radical SAM superfamily enzyme YgiQ (UPF0313 family)